MTTTHSETTNCPHCGATLAWDWGHDCYRIDGELAGPELTIERDEGELIEERVCKCGQFLHIEEAGLITHMHKSVAGADWSKLADVKMIEESPYRPQVR